MVYTKDTVELFVIIAGHLRDRIEAVPALKAMVHEQADGEYQNLLEVLRDARWEAVCAAHPGE